jgi:two-component system response regulator HydG
VVLSKSRTLGKGDFAFLRTAPSPVTKPRSLRDMEKSYVQQILEDCDWNVTKASKILDINRVTLHKMIKRLNLKRP